MKNILKFDPEAVAVVRGIDPLDRARIDADAGMDVDAAFAAVLARLESDAALATDLARIAGTPSSAPVPRRRGRRALSVGAVALGAAAAAFVVTNVASSGDGGVAPAQAKVLVARAQRALAGAAAPGTVQMVVSTSRKGDGPSFRAETWTELDAPFNSRTVSATAAGAPIEFGQTNGQDEFFDPSTGTLYRETEPFPAQEAGGSPALAGAAEFLARPGLSVDRDATLDGTPAIEASRKDADGSLSRYWFSKATYAPLRFADAAPGAGPGFVDTFERVDSLRGSDVSPADVSVAAHHAGAAVVELPNAAYVAKEEEALGG
jgi:hypothetical protein